MRVIKSISLYFVCSVIFMGLGFWCGFKAAFFFYPGVLEDSGVPDHQTPLSMSKMQTEQMVILEDLETGESLADGAGSGNERSQNSDVLAVQSKRETLCVDTEYILIETDLIQKNAVETTRRLPAQYIGMNREQFLDAMEVYEKSPPLSELERGFVGLEVQRFSRERVIVQMNYRYVQPGDGFYLAVKDHEIIVYLDDKETVYMDTGIDLDCIPESMQLDIIQMMYISDEGSLYNFLETYSS